MKVFPFDFTKLNNIFRIENFCSPERGIKETKLGNFQYICKLFIVRQSLINNYKSQNSMKAIKFCAICVIEL